MERITSIIFSHIGVFILTLVCGIIPLIRVYPLIKNQIIKAFWRAGIIFFTLFLMVILVTGYYISKSETNMYATALYSESNEDYQPNKFDNYSLAEHQEAEKHFILSLGAILCVFLVTPIFIGNMLLITLHRLI